MMRILQVSVGVVAAVAIFSIGAFFYFTRGVTAPTEAIQASVEELSASNSSNQTVYRIAQDESQAEYSIEEVLNGTPKTVVGTTRQVAGDILVNLSDPAQSQIGDLAINARTFATDDSRRDSSVARFILQSEADANQFITFKATSISGLPSSVQVGDTLDFEVTGDLTIAGTIKTVTFKVTATLKSADQLVGQAETTVQRSDFKLTIPNVPFVANVGETVTLKLDFVANAVTSEATATPAVSAGA